MAYHGENSILHGVLERQQQLEILQKSHPALLQHISKKTRLVGLEELRCHKALANMRLLQKGNRLSITPVDPAEWKFITEKLMK